MDPLRVYRDDLQQLVAPDETVRAASMCRAPLAGADRLHRTEEEWARQFTFIPRAQRAALARAKVELQANPPPPEKGWQRVLSVLSGGSSIVDGDPDSWLGGVAVAGAVGSCAALLHPHLGGGDSVYCVVTDRRLMLVAHGLQPMAFRPLAEVPLDAVARAQRRGRILQRGRVVIEFRDGSLLALFTGVFGTARANALVAALRGS
jgi:hypothetical protein